jgi:hypothetical protein
MSAAQERALDVAKHGIDPSRLREDKLEGGVACGLAARASHDSLVRATGVRYAAKTAQAIGDDFGPGLENAPGDGLDPAFVESDATVITTFCPG